MTTEWDDDEQTPVDPDPPEFGPPKLRSTPELEEARAQANREIELATQVSRLTAEVERLTGELADERTARAGVERDRARLLDELNRRRSRKKE